MNDSGSTSPKRLVLCFDGTGNKFEGKESDTNIVKIYRMLDRDRPEQFHYYQPGIGTYAQNQTSNSSTPRGLISRLKTSIEFSIDQAIGKSFVHHVLGGYQFLMRYYSPGDFIYIFGFSRGAYTARFLAEMVHDIGLLSKGNEEMVHFAWNTFSDYQRARSDTTEDEKKKEYVLQFRETFCRPNVEIYFLGLFDCVNSVGQFEISLFSKPSPYVPKPPAKYTRHAVSIHERRLKFKPALFQLLDSEKPESKGFDDPEKSKSEALDDSRTPRLVEKWFAGNHADIGGGWESKDGKCLLSEIPLKWMVEEIESLQEGPSHLAISNEKKSNHSHLAISNEKKYIRECTPPHDMLAFNKGTSKLGVLGWWILEILPFFMRLELEKGHWVPRHWPPNFGATRDIPTHAQIDESVDVMLKDGILKESQRPRHGGDAPPQTGFKSALTWYAIPSLLALGLLGLGMRMLRQQLF